MAAVRSGARTAERRRARAALAIRAGAVAAWLGVGAGGWFGSLVYGALLPDTGAARTTVTVALWLAYGVVLAALVLPGARALTVVRMGVPAGFLELTAGEYYPDDGTYGLGLFAFVGLMAAVVCTGLVMASAYGEAQVDAASYGDERRFLLRPPGPVVVALVVPVWAVAVGGVAVGPLLLAARGWPAGLVAAALGLPVAAFAAHTLSRLARRWLVFVPNGLVVHDHLSVAEALPLGRRGIASIGPARAGTAADDLTAQAFGMALELRLAGPVAASVVTGRNRSETRPLTALLVSPSRPAAVLATAERRGIKLA